MRPRSTPSRPSPRSRRPRVAVTAGLLGAALLVGGAAPPAPVAGGCSGQVVTDGVVTTTAAEPIDLAWTSFRPEVVPAGAILPVLLHSHGWGGSRSTTGFEAFTDACFLVVSFDQRGFGASGGQANIQDPELEGKDVASLIDEIATWDGVALQAPGDPLLGAIGGSYGGGYQWITALTEVRDTGATRFDAIAPEISWYDLPESLAPQGVVRTTWVAALYAAGAAALPAFVHEAFAWGATTGQWPDGTVLGQPAPVPDLDTVLHAHGPVAFADPDPDVRLTAERVQLDIPALVRQGSSDNLFNLNEGIKNFTLTLTDSARARSTFVAFNGGHALPNAVPLGNATGGDVCSEAAGGWTAVQVRFFQGAFGITASDTADLYGLGTNVVATTVDGDCIGVTGLGAAHDVPVDATPEDRAVGYGTTLFPMPVPVGAGAPVSLPLTPRGEATPLADGVTVLGIPRLLLSTTPLGPDQRLFFALSKGITPADARVVQNNVMPARWLLPDPANDLAGNRQVVELPAVVVRLAPGEQLFLTISPVSDMFPGHGSQRTPGAIALHIADVFLPHTELVAAG